MPRTKATLKVTDRRKMVSIFPLRFVTIECVRLGCFYNRVGDINNPRQTGLGSF